MSIPKEPRQLMVNLMYLVLTAMLDLNVSAEILSAFLSMNDSIQESNELVDNANDRMLNDIRQQAEAYQQYEPLRDKAMKDSQITLSIMGYIDQLKLDLIKASSASATCQIRTA